MKFVFITVFQPLKENRRVISKSRYDSIDSYLSPGSECYNDIDLIIDQDVYKQLKDAGNIYVSLMLCKRVDWVKFSISKAGSRNDTSSKKYFWVK